MNYFTDKEWEDYKSGNYIGDLGLRVSAILARLEAAEAYASYVAPIESKGLELLEVWRKAAGKQP